MGLSELILESLVTGKSVGVVAEAMYLSGVISAELFRVVMERPH